MKRIKQFRYYNEEETSKNSPSDASYTNWVSGNAFLGYFPITQLGIQALPGTRFYLNNSTDPIIIGSTGIYELDLTGETEISALSFNISSMLAIRDNNNAYVIVDVIYDSKEAN